MFMLIVLFSSCNQPELASDANGHIQYLQYLDGNVRSFDIINDSLLSTLELPTLYETLFFFRIFKNCEPIHPLPP